MRTIKFKLIILLLLVPTFLWAWSWKPPEQEPVKLVAAPFCFQSMQPSNSLSDADLVELARRYRVISDGRTGFTAKQMARLREIRPEIQIVRYLNFSGVSDPLKAGLILRDRPDWVMRDAAGNPTYRRLRTTGVMLRPNSEGWKWYLVRKTSRFLVLGYDGIMADCVMMCGRLGKGFTGINTETGHPYTTEEFRRHQLELVEAVKSALGQKSLVLNNVRRGEFYFSEEPYGFLDAADGLVAEGFRGYPHSSLEQHLSEITWLDNIYMMLDVQSRNKAIVVIIKIDKEVADRYTSEELRDYELFQYCTFLLGLEDFAYYTAHVTDPDLYKKTLLFYPHHEIPLGSPTGDYEKRDGYYQREFERGTVRINLKDHTGQILTKGDRTLD